MDDKIVWSPDDSKIESTISELKALSFELTNKGKVNSFPGVKMERDKHENITMTQKG